MNDLTPLQKLVIQHYAGGDMNYVTSLSEAKQCGDTLLTFCLLEAGDALDAAELTRTFARATDELRSLQEEINP